MNHLSELGILNFNDKKVLYLDTNDSLYIIKNNIEYFINKYKQS